MVGHATDGFLVHYGIPGMKWGKRNASKPTYDKSVKTFGGTSPHKNLNSSPKSIDAQKSHNYQSRVKSAGTDALSTKELKALVERQNLEQQYSRLNPKPVSLGAKLVGDLLPVVGTAFAAQRALRAPAPVEEPLSTALALPHTKKQMIADIVVATGKQVLAEQGANIGKAIFTSMLK